MEVLLLRKLTKFYHSLQYLFYILPSPFLFPSRICCSHQKIWRKYCICIPSLLFFCTKSRKNSIWWIQIYNGGHSIELAVFLEIFRQVVLNYRYNFSQTKCSFRSTECIKHFSCWYVCISKLGAFLF